MTLGDLLSQMGIGPKHLTERLSHGDYGGGHDSHHVIYAYEPSHTPHGHVASSKHHHGGGGGGHKSNAAMSALTLLAFLFFLHILQQCLKDHMTAMSTPPVVIMSSREGEEPISKTVAKLDKTGKNDATDVEKNYNENIDSKYEKDILMKINTAEHTPILDATTYRKMYQKYGNRTLDYRGFVSAMDDDDDNSK